MVNDDVLARARAIAAAVPDPEIPELTIADLGMLRDVTLDGDTIAVSITPSYSGCVATLPIAREVAAALESGGFADVRVRTVLSPPWSSDWITDEGRRKLRAVGIAPPTRHIARPICPRCGSDATDLISEFGGTPCKALHRCLACREPFEAFKCH